MKKRRTVIQKLNVIIRKARVPKYLHRKGPKTYTARQHVKCLLLRQKLKCRYDELVDEYLLYFGIKNIPERSTLIKFAKRIPVCLWNRILAASSEDECNLAAIDGTGISRTNASHYYLKRIDSDNPVKRHIKLSVMVNVEKRKFLSARIRSCPVYDGKDVRYLIENSIVNPEISIMDKGYDDNTIHSFLREKGIYSIIPAKKNCVRGCYRKEMRDYFDYGLYWQRNIVETLISCIKRKYGTSVNSKNIRSQRSDLYCRMILHNIFYFLEFIFTLAGKIVSYMSNWTISLKIKFIFNLPPANFTARHSLPVNTLAPRLSIAL